MKSPVIIVGMGEIGGEFARGIFRHGRPVHTVANELPDATAVVVVVAEDDIH